MLDICMVTLGANAVQNAALKQLLYLLRHVLRSHCKARRIDLDRRQILSVGQWGCYKASLVKLEAGAHKI